MTWARVSSFAISRHSAERRGGLRDRRRTGHHDLAPMVIEQDYQMPPVSSSGRMKLQTSSPASLIHGRPGASGCAIASQSSIVISFGDCCR